MMLVCTSKKNRCGGIGTFYGGFVFEKLKKLLEAGTFYHCTKWQWFVGNDRLIMVDGDIRGFLAKQGGQENSVAGTETDADKNKSISEEGFVNDSKLKQGGPKQDVFTTMPGRTSSGLDSKQGELVGGNERHEKSERGRGRKKNRFVLDGVEIECDEEGYFSKMKGGDEEDSAANEDEGFVSKEEGIGVGGEGGDNRVSIASAMGSDDKKCKGDRVLGGVDCETEGGDDEGTGNKNVDVLGEERMQEMGGREGESTRMGGSDIREDGTDNNAMEGMDDKCNKMTKGEGRDKGDGENN